jgi:hypothetical protein
VRRGENEARSQAPRPTERFGQPLGASDFLDKMEAQLGRNPKPAKRVPRPMEN